MQELDELSIQLLKTDERFNAGSSWIGVLQLKPAGSQQGAERRSRSRLLCIYGYVRGSRKVRKRYSGTSGAGLTRFPPPPAPPRSIPIVDGAAVPTGTSPPPGHDVGNGLINFRLSHSK